MSGLEIAFGIVLLVFSVGIVAIVLSQQGEQKNSGVITGGSSDTYISKNSGRTIDAFLARWTKFFAVGFFLCVIAVNIVTFCLGLGTVSAEDGDSDTSVSDTVEDTDSADSDEDGAVSDEETESADESADESSEAEESAASSEADESTAEESAA
jgi:preprotein translocase subunit SecG